MLNSLDTVSGITTAFSVIVSNLVIACFWNKTTGSVYKINLQALQDLEMVVHFEAVLSCQ